MCPTTSLVRELKCYSLDATDGRVCENGGTEMYEGLHDEGHGNGTRRQSKNAEAGMNNYE